MRTGLFISAVLLILCIGGGMLGETETRILSEKYISAAEEMRIMTEAQQWQRAEDTATAYIASWQDAIPWLQILINHEDIDDVTLALLRLQAGIQAQEQASCYEACAELVENARHIHHRDAFTLGNVL